MPVLVTGATGFIGRRLVARLRAEGETVRALVLPVERADLDGVEVARGDITDPASVRDAVRGCDRVYHLAAVVGDWGREQLFEQVNVTGTWHLLEAAAEAGADRLVMVSSIVVYGWQMHETTCHEDLPREHGVGPYSRTKRASEELALDYHAMGRLPVSVVRPGNVYGVGSDVWVEQLLEIISRKQAVLIDGGGGDAVLAHVDNVVDVIVRAGTAEHAPGRIYNANDGQGITWKQYLADLSEIAGVPAPRTSIPARAAWTAAAAMESAWKATGRAARPLLTREAVTLLASRAPVPTDRARRELAYDPPTTYDRAIAEIADHVHGGAP